MEAILMVRGKNVLHNLIGEIKPGSKIHIQLMKRDQDFCFTMCPNGDVLPLKDNGCGIYEKRLITHTDDNGSNVPEWPYNGFYGAKRIGTGLVEVTFYGVVQYDGKLIFVEDKQIVDFNHNIEFQSIELSKQGIEHISTLVAADNLPEPFDFCISYQIGTVIWYSSSRKYGVVYIGQSNVKCPKYARVYQSEIRKVRMLDFPELHAGEQVKCSAVFPCENGTPEHFLLFGVEAF